MKNLINYWRSNVNSVLILLFLLTPLIGSASAPTINGAASVCEGDVVTYSFPYTSGNSYNWSATGGTGIATINAGSGTAVFTVTWGLIGSASVVLQEYSGPTLVTNSTISVTINANPTPLISSNFDSDCVTNPIDREGQPSKPRPPSFDCETVCEFSPVTYNTTFTSGNTYSWTVVGDYTSILGATSNSAIVNWGSPGQAFVIVTETTPSGCSQTDTTCITIVDKPTSMFEVVQGVGVIPSTPSQISANTLSVCLNSTVCFNDLSVGGSSWYWNFGNGNSSIQQNPCETFTTTGTYLVTQVVENECHCSDTSYLWVQVTNEEGPDIVCQNVICDNGTFVYDAILPVPCAGGTYRWNISNNGTIVSANGTIGAMLPQYVDGTDVTSVEINWGSGPIGTISLQVGGCGGICDRIVTVDIPIIPNTIDITGDEVVCFEEAGYYEVPCFPGTVYDWKVDGVSTNWSEHTLWYEFLSPGLHTVQVDYSNTFLNCIGGSTVFNVDVLNPFEISGPGKVCEGNSITISGPIGSLLTWTIKSQGGSPITIGGTSSSVAIPTTLAPGSYTVSAQDVSAPRDYCNDYAVFGITVIPQPPAPTTINGPTEVCLNEVNVYTASPTSSDYYLEWEVDNGSVSTSNGNSVTVSWTAAVKTITLYHVSKVSNCKSTGYVLTVNDKTPPPVVITGPTNVCANTDTFAPEVYSTSAVLDDYEWAIIPATAGSVTSGQGTNSVSVIWNNYNGSADVRLTPITCNTPAAPVDYPVNVTSPVMVISGPGTICENSGGTWSSSFTPSGSPTGEIWSITDINGSIVASGSGSSANFNFAGLSGSFILTMTATNCAIIHTETFNITVNPAPVANLSYTGGINCIDQQNATLLLSVQGAGSHVYDWLHNGISQGNLGTSHNIGMNAADAGSWTVRVVNTVTGCQSQTNIINARVCSGPPPPCTSHLSNVSFVQTVSQIAPSPGCNFVNFASSFTGMIPTSYLWDFAGLAPGLGASPNYTFPASGVYPVTVIASYASGFCDKSFTFDVIVPIITDFEINISCASGSALNVDLINTTDVIFGPFNNANYNFNWTLTDLSGPTVVATSTSQDFTGVPSLVGGTSYDIELVVTRIATGDVCTYTESFVMPDNAAADFTITNPTVCEGNPVTFSDNSTGNIIGWEWTFDDGSEILTQNPHKTYVNPGIYDVILEVTDEYGCVNTSSIQQVDVKPNLITGNTTISPVQPMCPGTTATITFNNNTPLSSGPFSYLWSDNTTGISTTSTQTSTFYLGVTDNYGCFADFGPATVEVVEIPNAIINGLTDYCVGDDINLVCNYGSSYTYTWFEKLQGAGSFSNTGIIATEYTVANAPIGTHEFKAVLNTVGSPTCAKESFVFTVTVHPNPPIPLITTNPTPACPNTTVNLTVTNSALYNSISWSTGDVSASTVATNSSTYYAVGTDSNGCSSFEDVEVFELPDFCSFMCGCYSNCIERGGSFNFPGILGSYQSWKWEEFDGANWDPLTSGTGAVNDLEITTAGTYTIRLYVETFDGCGGYSCETDLTITYCADPCEADGIMEYIKCNYDEKRGVFYDFGINFNFGGVGNDCEKYSYTITPPVGFISSSSLNPNYLTVGSNFINGQWFTNSHYYPGGIVCFTIDIMNLCDSSVCTYELCFEVEKCGNPNAKVRKTNSSGSEGIQGLNKVDDQNGEIKFYPNPTNGLLKISAPEKGNYDITIFDISGKVVFTHILTIDNAQVIEFNLQSLPVGPYHIQCIGNESIKTESLIIIK
jgi:PKD repeat protein